MSEKGQWVLGNLVILISKVFQVHGVGRGGKVTVDIWDGNVAFRSSAFLELSDTSVGPRMRGTFLDICSCGMVLITYHQNYMMIFCNFSRWTKYFGTALRTGTDTPCPVLAGGVCSRNVRG